MPSTDGLRQWWRRVRRADQLAASASVLILEERTENNELRIQALEEQVRVLEIRHGLYRPRETSS